MISVGPTQLLGNGTSILTTFAVVHYFTRRRALRNSPSCASSTYRPQRFLSKLDWHNGLAQRTEATSYREVS